MTQNAHLTNCWGFPLQFFCNDVCSLQEYQHTKNIQSNAVGDLVWTFGCENQGSRHGPLGTVSVTGECQGQVLRKACKWGYIWTLSLKLSRHGDYTLGSWQNHTHFGPQITFSVGLWSAT